MELNLPQIFESNGVENGTDVLHLVRSLINVPRAHTLPMANRESILEHCARAVMLFDYMNHTGLITPKLEGEEQNLIRNYLLYHDVHEVVTGDIPYFIEKALGREPSRVRDQILPYFGAQAELEPELFKLAKVIDALDFCITISEDPVLNSESYNGKRLRQARTNALEIVGKMVEGCKPRWEILFGRLMPDHYKTK